MNVVINKLVQSLLQKDTLEQCSVRELQQLAHRYPYFGPVQLLLAKKLQTENPDEYNRHIQKTSLFFYNPLWLAHLLSDTGNADIIPPKPVDTPVSLSTVPAQDKEEEKQDIKTEPVVIPVEKEPVPGEMASLKIEPVDPAKAELIFEPYHMVDYFASQGIKFKEEEQPKDKFGQQLKSFTEWLKTMKRLPVSEITRSSEPGAEQKVEQLAEHSIQDREVITEAMAEVWEKQGNAEKAIEIYNKLSLLDPSKSPYFATKISALKKTN